MISEENEQRLNNLRKQLHRVKMAKRTQEMTDWLADQLITELTKRIQAARG